MKVALVHDWLVSRRGGEKVLEELIQIFPQADLKVLFGQAEVLRFQVQGSFETTFLSSLPGLKRFYPYYLPLFPLAVESLDLSAYDLVISSSHCVAKGVLIPAHVTHVCYLHSPMRYLWDQTFEYFQPPSRFWNLAALFRQFFLNQLRMWEQLSLSRVDFWITNSETVKDRLFSLAPYLSQPIATLFPPVNWESFWQEERFEDCFLPQKPQVILWGAWVPYKKIAWAVEQIWPSEDYDLVVCGQGPERKFLQDYQKKYPFRLYEKPSQELLQDLVKQSHVMVFPGWEDFGIAALEALAAGLWLVYADGGGVKEIAKIFPERSLPFRWRDGESLRGTLQSSLKQRAPQKQLGPLFQERFQSFSSERFQKKFFDLLKEWRIDAG